MFTLLFVCRDRLETYCNNMSIYLPKAPTDGEHKQLKTVSFEHETKIRRDEYEA
jgi:hypothetical protein